MNQQVITLPSSGSLGSLNLHAVAQEEEDDQQDVERLVRHEDFVKLLTGAARLKKLNPVGKTEAHQIMTAVLNLLPEFMEYRKKEKLSAIPRGTHPSIDDTIDQCIKTLQQEIERHAEQEQQEREQSPAPSKVASPKLIETCRTDDDWHKLVAKISADFLSSTQEQSEWEIAEQKWERMLEQVSEGFDETRHAINEEDYAQLVYMPDDEDNDCVMDTLDQEEEEEPITIDSECDHGALVMFAEYWSEQEQAFHAAGKMDTDEEKENEEEGEVAVVTDSEDEQDPLGWFADYWTTVDDEAHDDLEIMDDDMMI